MYLKPHSFRKTVSSAGTRERLTTSDIRVISVTIQAIQANTNDVYAGDDQVSSSKGIELDSTDSITLDAKNYGMGQATISLKDIWLDVDTGGEGVNVLYLQATSD